MRNSSNLRHCKDYRVSHLEERLRESVSLFHESLNVIDYCPVVPGERVDAKHDRRGLGDLQKRPLGEEWPLSRDGPSKKAKSAEGLR